MKRFGFFSLVLLSLVVGCSPSPSGDSAGGSLKQQILEMKSETTAKAQEFKRRQQKYESEIRELEEEKGLLQEQIQNLESRMAASGPERESLASTRSETTPDKIGLRNGHTFFAEVTSIQGENVHISIGDKKQIGPLSAVDFVDFRSRDPAQ